MTTPDTTEAAKQGIEAAQDGIGGQFAKDAAIAALKADRAELDRLGFDIVERGSVPDWMEAVDSQSYNGGTAFGITMMRDNPFTLYRLAPNTPKTEDET